jgi:hypothetical protein
VSGVRVPPPLLGHFRGCPPLLRNSRFPALSEQGGFSFASRRESQRAFASPVDPQFRPLPRNGRRSTSGSACARRSADRKIAPSSMQQRVDVVGKSISRLFRHPPQREDQFYFVDVSDHPCGPGAIFDARRLLLFLHVGRAAQLNCELQTLAQSVQSFHRKPPLP